MGDFPRKADGKRIFTVEFKRGVVQPILNKSPSAGPGRS